MEYLTIITFSLMIMIPIIVLSVSYSDNYNYKFKSYQAQKALDTFSSISDELFFEGYPSKRTVKIFIPDNVVDFYVLNDNVLFFVLRQKDDFIKIYSYTKYANLSVQNFTGSGYLTFELYTANNNTVVIKKV